MARIRTIKPAFFTSEDTCRLSPLTRLLFVGLWTEADREGRLHDRPGQLKHRLLPGDDCEIDELLQELHSAGRIRRYRIGGTPVIEITKFAAHQKPHPKEAPSIIPAFGSDAIEIKARPQHVYFIHSASQHRIKIGVSSVPRHRMSTLQTSFSDPLTLLGACEGGIELESRLHDELASFRRQGEWFDDCPEVRAVVQRQTQTWQSPEKGIDLPVENPSSPARNGSGDLGSGVQEGKGREPTPSPVQKFPLKPLIAKRNLHAAYEHPRFDVPQRWHDDQTRALAGGEARLMKFYRWLGDRVERTGEDTAPRFKWLDDSLAVWLAESAAPQFMDVDDPNHPHNRRLAEMAARGVR